MSNRLFTNEQIAALSNEGLWRIYNKTVSVEDSYAAKLELQRRQLAESKYPGKIREGKKS